MKAPSKTAPKRAAAAEKKAAPAAKKAAAKPSPDKYTQSGAPWWKAYLPR